jgi:hypothetical protein
MDVSASVVTDHTRDGVAIRIAAIRPSDKSCLAAFHRRLSPDSVYLRFFDFKNELSEKDLHYLTELDFDQRVALVATFERVCGSR